MDEHYTIKSIGGDFVVKLEKTSIENEKNNNCAESASFEKTREKIMGVLNNMEKEKSDSENESIINILNNIRKLKKLLEHQSLEIIKGCLTEHILVIESTPVSITNRAFASNMLSRCFCFGKYKHLEFVEPFTNEGNSFGVEPYYYYPLQAQIKEAYYSRTINYDEKEILLLIIENFRMNAQIIVHIYNINSERFSYSALKLAKKYLNSSVEDRKISPKLANKIIGISEQEIDITEEEVIKRINAFNKNDTC